MQFLEFSGVIEDYVRNGSNKTLASKIASLLKKLKDDLEYLDFENAEDFFFVCIVLNLVDFLWNYE